MITKKPHDICERSFLFAVQIVPLCETLCDVPGARRAMGHQLLRAATSAGTHIEEAQAGQARPDFIAKNALALQEIREAAYWLRLIMACGFDSSRQIEGCLDEAEELKNILAAIIISAKKNLP